MSCRSGSGLWTPRIRFTGELRSLHERACPDNGRSRLHREQHRSEAGPLRSEDHDRRFIASSLWRRSEEHTSELQSLTNLVCRLLLEKKNTNKHTPIDNMMNV